MKRRSKRQHFGREKTNLSSKEKYKKRAETTYAQNNLKQAQKGPKRTVADLAFFRLDAKLAISDYV